MRDSMEENQSNNNPEASSNTFQRSLMLIPDNQGIFCFLKKEEKSPNSSPSFFSEMGLDQDIIKVTGAEPDICLEVFYSLYQVLWPQIEKQSDISLKDAWKNFIGGSIFKGVLCPPERLIGKKKPKDIKKILSEDQEHQVFEELDVVVKSISNLKQKIVDSPDQLLQKEEIITSLDLAEGFFQGYRNQVKALVRSILEKEQMNVACVSEYDALVDVLEPKAVMMSDIWTHHWAYRIPRNKAQKMLSLGENERPLRSDLNEASNHRVVALPERSEALEPLVYFKANGVPAIQPEREFMLYSLYKHLKIPAPETALLILTDVFEGNSDFFYAVQASEAVIGQSAVVAVKNQATIFEQEAYASQVIGALLTNPSDGSFQNFKYSSRYKTLVGIDNDLIFGPELTGDDDGKVNIRSALYLLPLMDNSIPTSIQTYFTTLDPDLILFAWLHDLERKNREYGLLFARLSYQHARSQYQGLSPQDKTPSLAVVIQEKIKVDSKLFESHNQPFSPQIMVSKNLLSRLQTKLNKIQKVFLDNRSTSPQILFNEISAMLGKYYQRLRLEFRCPEQAIEALWGERNKGGIAYCYISSLLNVEKLSSTIKIENALENERKECEPESFFEEWRKTLTCENRQTPLDSLIKRHSERKMKDLLDLQELLKELQFLTQEGLTDSKSFRDIVDFWYGLSKITEKQEIVQETRSLLSNLRHGEMQWLLTLEKHFLRSNEFPLEPSPSTIHGAFMKQRTFDLTESEKEYIFDDQGHIKKNAFLTGRANVTCFPEKNPEFYLKQYPEWPGYEFASILFMRMLGVTRLPYQELIIINSKYPVLLTQGVDGDPVFRVWQNPEAFMNLDPFHTGLLIIAAMLINPEDGKEDNFLLSKDGKYLIPVDNDHCFLPSTFQKGAFWNLVVNTALQTKTLLFCLDEMNKPIPNQVKQHILSVDFDFLLKSWMQQLIKVEDRYSYLVDQEERNAFLKNGTVLRIPFYEPFIRNLYWKVITIQDLLKSTSEQTPLSLLKAVEPFVARCYQDSFQHGSTLQGRFKAATNKLYFDAKTALNGSRTSILNTQSMMNIINVSEKDIQNDVAYNKMGPSDACELFKQLIEEQSQKRIMEQDLLCELDDKNEGGIWTTLFGNPLLETALKDFFTSQKEGLVLKGSKLITRSKLTDLFAQAPDKGMRIRFLSLPESPFLTDKEMRILAEECPNIEYLNVSECMKLEEIVTVKGEWPLLARLEARDCFSLQKLVSYSPIKILRIGTHQRIRIFIEKCLLDIFAISTKTNRFNFLLEKGDSFQINHSEEMISPEHFLQSFLFEKEKFDKYFRNPKITIGMRPILSAEDLEFFIQSIDFRNSDFIKENIQKLSS